MKYKIEVKDNKRYIYLPELEQMGLKHCFTTRDMDVGSSTNPDKESIQGYINEAYEFMDIKPEILYNGYQAHTSNIEPIHFLDQGKEGAFGRFIPNTDGLLTDLNNVALLTRFADCVPIILFDKEKKIQANIHSGWKGTLERIAQKGVLGLMREYGSSEEDIIAVIGPAIGRDDFQVREDVGSLFLEEFSEWKELVRKVSEKVFLIDLQEINRRMILAMGVDERNITVIDISTYERDDLCHSYRRDKEDYGLMGLFTIIEG